MPGYSMIIAKVFEGSFKASGMDVKLTVFDDE